MDTTPASRRVIAALAASAFGIAAPLTVASLADAAVHGPGLSHSRDWDGDKMPNRWELKHGLDAHKANARRDADRDGSRNLTEFREGTDPQDDDSDDDGVEDGDDDSPDCADDSADDTSTSDSDDSDDSDDCEDADDADDADDAAMRPGARHATYIVG